MADHNGKHADTPEVIAQKAQDSAHLLEQSNIEEFRTGMAKDLQGLGSEGRKLYFDKLKSTIEEDKTTNAALADIEITDHAAGGGIVTDISRKVAGEKQTVVEVAGANSQVIAGADPASAYVIADAGSKVIAKDGATVTALDKSDVTALGSEHLLGNDSISTSYTQVNAKEGSHVQALSNANVFAESGAVVEAERGSMVKAEKGSTVIYSPGADIQAAAGAKLTKSSDVPNKREPHNKGGN